MEPRAGRASQRMGMRDAHHRTPDGIEHPETTNAPFTYPPEVDWAEGVTPTVVNISVVSRSRNASKPEARPGPPGYGGRASR